MRAVCEPQGESVRVGVVGHGWWFRSHLWPSLAAHPDIKLVGLAGRSATRARSAAEEFDIPYAYGHVKDMIGDQTLDGVIICSPPSSHHEVALHIAQAAIPTFSVKPFTATLLEAAEVLESTAELPTMLGYTHRANPVFQAAKAVLDNRGLGEPVSCRYMYTSDQAWDHLYRSSWRFDPRAEPYGVLNDLGCQALDAITWLLGDVATVSARAGVLEHRGSSQSGSTNSRLRNWDYVNILLGLESGVDAAVTVSRASAPGPMLNHAFEVVCKDGALSYAVSEPTALQIVSGGVVRKVYPKLFGENPTDYADAHPRFMQRVRHPHVSHGTALESHCAREQANAIISTFRGSTPEPYATFHDGYRVQALVEDVAKAAANWRAVNVIPMFTEPS